MHQSLASLEIKALERMYVRETQILKLKLLSGALLKDILKQKNKAIELALAIQEKQYGDVFTCNNIAAENI